MGWAVLDILGAFLAFGAFTVTYGLFNANIPIKIVNFLMLVGVIVVAVRSALISFRSATQPKTVRVSRILAGSYGIVLVLAALYCIILLFTA